MTSEVLPDEGTAFGQQVRERLRNERVIWFTTVGRNGTPQPNPVWFVWTGGDEVVTYNLPSSSRLAHIADRPQVALHFNSDGAANHVVVMTGRAERAGDLPAADASPEYLARYREDMERVSGSPEEFAAVYSVPLRTHIARVRGY